MTGDVERQLRDLAEYLDGGCMYEDAAHIVTRAADLIDEMTATLDQVLIGAKAERDAHRLYGHSSVRLDAAIAECEALVAKAKGV
jgi:hypothetical protein